MKMIESLSASGKDGRKERKSALSASFNVCVCVRVCWCLCFPPSITPPLCPQVTHTH